MVKTNKEVSIKLNNLQSNDSEVRHIKRLPNGINFYLLASIVVFFLASASVPTPLYAIYQSQWGFASSTLTIIFGVYALAVLGSLLVVGSLSDYIGRRPVLLTSVFIQAGVMIVFSSADNVTMLIIARILQGLTTGAALGALGAGMLDINISRGTIANAVATPLGTAVGAIGASLLIRYLPYPTHLSYVVLLVIFMLQGIGLLFTAESVTPKAGALASLKPQLSLPKNVRGPMLISLPVLVAVWILAGFYGALGPSVISEISHTHSIIVAGLTMFVLAGAGTLTVLLIQKLGPQNVMYLGSSALVLGLGTTLLSVTTNSSIEFFTGTAIAGIGFGAGFQGVLRTVMPLATPEHRAGILAIIFLISYLSFGIPPIAAGFLVVHTGLVFTTQICGWTILVLGLVTIVALAGRAFRK